MEMDEIKQKVLEDVDPPTRTEKRKVRRRNWAKTLLEFAGIIVIIFLLFQFVWGLSVVEGNSMYPTLHDGDLVIYYRLEKSLSKGDVVIIDRPNDETFVKRVAAVAGDTVNIEGGQLYVNGKETDSENILGETAAEGDLVEYPVTLDDGEIFVLGDNRVISEDSRMFGPVKTDDVNGRLLWYLGKVK